MSVVEGLDVRTKILEYSLIVENWTSIFLSTLLDIPDYKQTKSLGNKSGNLSFNQKIDLLIDIQALDKKEKKKFLIFMSIRNQFMHNFDANTYENCFSNIDGANNFILKTYPQNELLDMEDKLRSATKELADEVVDITLKLLDKIKDKFKEKAKAEILEEYQINSSIAITEIEKAFNSVYDTKVKSNEKTINIEELKELGTLMRRIYIQKVINKISKDKK